VALPVENAIAALNLSEHLINNVDIIRGQVREPTNGQYINETTQWVVFKDLTHKVFYYRTYGDLSLHAVSMSKVNFAENATRLQMPITSDTYIRDVTDDFLKTAH